MFFKWIKYRYDCVREMLGDESLRCVLMGVVPTLALLVGIALAVGGLFCVIFGIGDEMATPSMIVGMSLMIVWALYDFALYRYERRDREDR